ncbi:unnamed protein product [Rotaria socialis]|uniref:Uncharacterized protein n=1 Tax=Rotaria socialis TaxID=392032 RepID=A0A819AFZ8_9BILA|nr:unnamed protein product [Rotaria socialis]
MQEIKKAEKQMILQQQLQSTISVSQVPSSQSCVSSMQISTDQTINTQTTPNINSAPASQSQNNAKRLESNKLTTIDETKCSSPCQSPENSFLQPKSN